MMVQKIVTFDVALKSTERQWVQKVPEVYTNDLGSVTIQFKITDCTDVELTNSTAIVLLKMRDGSFFQGPSVDVERTLNVFSYTLKENEGNHDGLAEIQLVVTIAGKEFGTQKYNFKVISGLDSEIAREIMIYDWSTLTAEARAYIDQFTADELLRDAEFDNNQFDRNVAFNTAQGQRVSDFNAAEAARVLAFNNAETDRSAGYDADHSRAGTDHTGATTDRTNAAAARTLAGTDHTTAAGDHTTALSDHAVLGGFNGRLTDVEVDTSFDATNAISNGDFSNGTNGWSTNQSTLSVAANEGIITPTELGGSNGLYRDSGIPAGNKVYITGEIYPKYPVLTSFGFSGGEQASFYPIPNIWNRKSAVLKSAVGSIIFYHTFNAGGYLITDTIKFRRMLMLNLTAIFGAGNEPTVEQMDAIMAKFENSWFDGTKNLFQAKASLNKLMALDVRTEFEAKNGIINGNFSNGTMGWSAPNATLTPLGNGKVNSAPTSVSPYIEPSNLTTIPAKNGNKIYMSAYIKTSPDATTERLMISGGITQVLLLNNGPLRHTSGALVSSIATLSGQTDGRMITAYLSNTFASAEIAGSSSFSFGYVTLIDLTAAFGAGKEPTLAEMDRLMARFPNSWFDGVKPIQTIETLYQEKANKVQEAWITPTLLNGWVDFGGGLSTCQYMKDELGFVHLKGVIKSGVVGNDCMILPVGYRPLKNQYHVGMSVDIARVINITSAGGVNISSLSNNSWVTINGIQFRAEV